MDSSNLINLSIVTYVSFTFLFFVIKFRFFPQNNYYWIIVFLIISCISQLIQNINVTASPDICGKGDFKMALYATIVPWVLVFTIFSILIISSPGWLRVFSNTFGLFAAESYGIKEIINNVLQKPVPPKSTEYEYLKMLENIYSDRMALVIELNLDDVTDVGGVFNFPALQKLEELGLISKDEPGSKPRRDLYNALLLKDNVGFFFWFLLIGIFCILVSTNTLLTSTCSPKIGSSYNTIFNS